MAVPREAFIDPNGVKATYEFHVNHSEETEFGKERAIQHGANTANTGLVRQQSDDQPLVWGFSGTIFHKVQITKMLEWFALSKGQTIYFRDFTGDVYEVIWTSFKPTRHKTIKNPRDYANCPYHYWTYDMAMEVVRVVSGIWVGAA